MEIEQSSTESPLGQGRNKDVKDFLRFNGNNSTTQSNLWDTTKAVLRGKFIEVNTYVEKLEESLSSESTEQLESIEQK